MGIAIAIGPHSSHYCTLLPVQSFARFSTQLSRDSLLAVRGGSEALSKAPPAHPDSHFLFHFGVELTAGVSNGAKLIPYDCALRDEGDTPKSVRALWLRVIFPLILLLTYWVLLVFIWGVCRIRARDSSGVGLPTRSFVTYLIVVTITVVFFGYNTITEELMRTVNCIDVEIHPNAPFAEHIALTNELFWAEDTDLICFQGDHKVTSIFGILGLALFSFGFIAFIFFWLFWNQNVLSDIAFITRYGFIYRAYRKGRASPEAGSRETSMQTGDEKIMGFLSRLTIYWEAVITMRKALISAAVVFAYKLGSNLQSVLALGVLVLALGLQLLFRPFRKFPCFSSRRGMRTKRKTVHDNIDLNHLESFSIFASAATFYSGIVFEDEQTSDGGRIAMSVFVYVTNIALLVYFVWRIYEGTHVTLNLKLTAWGQPHDENGWLPVKIVQLFRGYKEMKEHRKKSKSRYRRRRERSAVELAEAGQANPNGS